MDKIKVVWLCHFSNEQVYNRLDLGDWWFKGIIRKIMRKPLNAKVPDFAIWITNGIREFEKNTEVELHVVSPYPYLKNQIQEFERNGVYYHFFHNEDEDLMKQIMHSRNKKYHKNRKTISQLIKKINPDIVHLFGAENPYYSLGLLDVPSDTITIVQLQTLLNDKDIQKRYPCFKDYHYKCEIEQQIITRATYVGTTATKFRKIIHDEICPTAIILNTSLALVEPLFVVKDNKQFDFVYFASNINKAADLAIEAFGRAYQKNPNITLDIIGGYDADFKQQLDETINHYEMKDAVRFEGSLLTHDDVLCQIRKARFALLPLRTDLTSGTIREAMSNGLPVLTTDTGELGTQKLNQKRQNALITPIGDHQALADNMLRLLNDEASANTLRQNAYQTRSEVKSNAMVIQKYVEAYKTCLDNYKNGTPIPETLTKIN
jgi:glycosyltransferase involved in cell wall biosynthesis